MKVTACPTRLIQPGEKITKVLDEFLPPLSEGTIIAVTGKVVSVCENRLRSKEEVSKADLIIEEADAFLETERHSPFPLTIKSSLLTASAGVDESNGHGKYVLHPKDVQASARAIWEHLRRTHRLQEVGVIITDSNPTPLRRGVVGVAIGWCGLQPLYRYQGKLDLFGRPFAVTFANLLDALAAAAVLMMGEGDESTPLCTIENPPKVEFVQRGPTQEEESFFKMPLQDDLYRPLLTALPWSVK